MRRVTDGEREKGGGIVMVFAVRVDNLCSIKADGIMAGAVVWSEDGRLCLGGAQARWIQGLSQLDLSPAKRKLGLSIRWILLNPSSFPLGKVHGDPNLDSSNLMCHIDKRDWTWVRSIITCSRGDDDPSDSNELLLHLVLNIDPNFIELLNRH